MRRISYTTLAVLALAAVVPARADLFLVGPGGTHSTIQAAVDAARATPGADSIRVATGTWTERVEIVEELGAPTGALSISGGWTAPGYVERVGDAGATVVSAGGAGRPLLAVCHQDDLTIENLTFRDGRLDESSPSGGSGGGVEVGAWGGCEIAFLRNEVLANRVAEVVPEPTRGVVGGGLSASAGDGGSLVVSGNLFEANEVASADHGGGGGASFVFDPGATFSITGNRFAANRVIAVGQANAAGLELAAYGGPVEGDFSDNRIVDNLAQGGSEVVPAAGFYLSGTESIRVTMRRNEFRGTFGGSSSSAQVFVRLQGTTELTLSDSLFAAAAETGGVYLDATDGARLVATNLTAAGHGGSGIIASEVDGGSVEVWNSISFGNGISDSFGPGTERHAHFTVDPRFADATRGDYHLRLDSPAIDAGLSGVPGGLGPADLDLGPRVRGAAVDLGAYEHRSASGGACEVRRFGPVPFVDAFAPVCACLRDDGLRTSRCGGFALPMFFDVIVPPPPGPFGEVEVRIRPWELGSGDYQLAAQLLHASKVDPVEIVGPKSGRFHAGKELRVKLRYLPTGRSATLRLAMRYRPDGEQELRETWFDVRVDPDEP